MARTQSTNESTAPQPTGLVCHGTITRRWKKVFQNILGNAWAKVWYDIQTLTGQTIELVQTHDHDPSPDECLPIGSTGFWPVEVSVYKKKTGEVQYSLALMSVRHEGEF